MSIQRRKGTTVEETLATFLREHGWPYAETRRLHGVHDRGDIAGTPGITWEAKWAGRDRLRVPEWMAQTEVERMNNSDELGILVVKPKGIGVDNVHRWWAISTLAQQVQLARLAGYGDSVKRL